jgi:integrase
MAVYDRWHRDPQEGLEPCRCGRGRNKLYPSGAHLKGDRWQVRWRDPATGRQPKKNFAERDGDDPELHAAAFDKVIQAQILTRTYVDPRAGEVTLHDFTERWRKGRKLDVNPAANLEARLRLHVYEEPGGVETPKGGVAIGRHPMALLAQTPSMMSDWIEALPLAANSARLVVGDMLKVFDVAVGDGVVMRNPLRVPGVKRPKAGSTLARPWALWQVRAMEGELPPRWAVVPELGAGTAMRQGEMLGLALGDVDWLKRDDPRVRVERALKVVGNELRFGPVKNRKPHSVPLAPSLKERLQRHLDEFPAVDVTLPWHDPKDKERHGQPVTVRLLITTAAGAAVEHRAFDKVWRRARKRARVVPAGARQRDNGCHVLRHTGASAWLRAGIDIVRVAAWMGDTVQVVASTYAHLMPGGSDDDGRGAVAGFFAGPVPGDGASAPDVPSAASS